MTDKARKWQAQIQAMYGKATASAKK